MSWTEEKVNKLKELWGKGKTARQIAEIYLRKSDLKILIKKQIIVRKIKKFPLISQKNFRDLDLNLY